MEENKQHFQDFKERKTASLNSAIYTKGLWMIKYIRHGNLSLKIASQPDWPVEVDGNYTKTLLKNKNNLLLARGLLFLICCLLRNIKRQSEIKMKYNNWQQFIL